MRLSKMAFLALLSSGLFADQNQTVSYNLGETVISASGFEQDADSNLRNVIVISSKDLQDKGYISLEQALERVSGISFVNFGLGRNIDMRGQGSKSNVSVKVMVDGRPINVLDNSHGVTPLDGINLSTVERIEIIPGGGSVLYGNGTRGGVINIITKKEKQDGFEVALNGGGYDKRGMFGDIDLGIDKNINENLSLNFDIKGFNEQGFQDGYSQKGFYANAKALFDFNDEASKLGLSLSYFDTKNTSTGYLTKEQIESDPRQKGSGDNITNITRPEVSLDFSHKFSDQFEFMAKAFYQYQEIRYEKDVTSMAGINAYQDGSGFEDILSGVNLKAKFDYLDNSYLVFGYDFLNHDAKRKSITYYSIPQVFSHHMDTTVNLNKQSHSVFLLDSHSFNDFFYLSGGARMEYAKYKGDRLYINNMDFSNPGAPDTFESLPFTIEDKDTLNYAFEITPNVKFSDTGSVYLKFESSFVSPTPAQLVSKNAPSAGGNYYTSNLVPEKYQTYELGIKDFWWDFHKWQINFFYTQSKDEISYLGNPHATGGSFWHYYNIDKTRRYGAEVILEQSFIDDRLVTKQSLSYIDAKISGGINKGKLIPYVSRVKSTASVDFSFNKYLSSFVNLTYFSRSKDSGSVNDSTGKMVGNAWIRDYFLTDLGATFKYDNLQVLAGIKNLFDKKYYTYQNSISDQYLPGNGRSYYLQFKYKY